MYADFRYPKKGISLYQKIISPHLVLNLKMTATNIYFNLSQTNNIS
jgi:hypothetical protein